MSSSPDGLGHIYEPGTHVCKHAAVVARQMNKVGLAGCTGLSADGMVAGRSCTIGARKFYEGNVVTLDVNPGLVSAGTSLAEWSGASFASIRPAP